VNLLAASVALLALRERLPYATVFTHLDPADDPRSFDDTTLDRP
jgi:hypothetical protein